jgi:GH25 family lysozyme M1 (1,4-beta-N-acetylmuramidase)
MVAKKTSGNVAAAAKTILGVDVSSFQGPPAAWRAEAGGIKWAAVKLTELQPNGVRYINPDAAADWAFVKQQKLGRIAYLFGHPSVSVAETVTFFTGELKALGLLSTDGVMLDLETTDGLGPGAVSSWAVEVMAGLAKALNRTPILYTFLSFAEEGNTAGLGKYPLWISDPSSPEGHPRVPAPWKTWVIHQYETSGAIDRDLARFATVSAMEQAFGEAQAPKPKPKKPQSGNLGGSVSGGVAAVRWADGSILLAGLDHLSHVQVKRFDGETGKWGVWWNPTKDKALGAPGLLAWGATFGQLYYAVGEGQVIELATEDMGKSWK